MNKSGKALCDGAEQLKESGYQAFQQGDHQKAIDLWQEAVQRIEGMEEADLHLKGRLLFNLGLACSKQGRNEDAVRYYHRAVDLFIPEENSCFIGKAFMGMGQSYRRLNDLDQAIACAEQAIAIFQSQNDSLTAERARVNCGLLYRDHGKLEEAVALLESSLAVFTNWNRTEEAKVVSDHLAEIRKGNFLS